MTYLEKINRVRRIERICNPNLIDFYDNGRTINDKEDIPKGIFESMMRGEVITVMSDGKPLKKIIRDMYGTVRESYEF